MRLKDEITKTIMPGNDFYRYANQRWLDSHPIPSDKARLGVMEVLTDSNLTKLRQLLESPVKNEEPDAVKLVKSYYQSAMDEDAIARSTPDFIKQSLEPILKLKDSADVGRYLAEKQAQGRGLLWELIIEPDDKDSQRYLARFWQSGLGLPERTYYLEENETFQAVRQQYHQYLVRLFRLIGWDRAEARAKRVYQLELQLAEASLSAADCRDPERVYNLFSIKELERRYNAVDWGHYMSTIGLKTAGQVNIGQPDFMAAANRLLSEAPISDWQDYLTVRTLNPLMNKLSKPYDELVFDFYGKVLTGRQQQEPRHLRMIRQCMLVLPEPTGRIFVEHYFDETSKDAIKDLVDHLKRAFEVRLDRLDWMTEETKRKAHHKLSTFLPLLGYPDEWKPYDGLKLGPDYVHNFIYASEFDWHYRTERIDQPVDRTEWLMSPALVNAYYWPNTNGITFPAGILQPPFFDPEGDFAANYGAIGAVIGHELTHGFDDQGSQYDAEGNLESWWQTADRQAFETRAKRLVEQYNGYKLAGRHIDGQLTLGENIADLGGLLIAFDALKQKLAESGQTEAIDGFSPEQRFFISYAKTWCGQTREELLLQYIVSDPHSPDIFRVNGVVPNIDAFYEAFAVETGQELYIAPDKRVRIW